MTKQHDRHTHCANHNGFDIPPERIARLQDDTREVNDAIPILRDRITVVVLTHNRCDELLRTLAHIQALPEQPAIVVVDNASTDGTTTCLASHRYKDVRLIKAERNLGAAGRNLGVNVVRTPYVAFCDDDTWWEPGALHTAVKLLDEHAQIAVLNANILVGPAARPDPACLAMASSPLEHVTGIGPMLAGFMAGACVMRTCVFLHAGGYWDNFFIGGEETLLALDVLDAGHHIVYAPALTVHHWPSHARDSGLRRHLLARNAIWTAWLRLPWHLAWRQTYTALKQVPEYRQRWRTLTAALIGSGPVLAKRRVVHPKTYQLLERVWQHEALSGH